MIYLDTCILIYAVEDAGERGRQVRNLLDQHDAEGFAISSLVTLECLVSAYRSDDADLGERYEAAVERVTVVPMPDAVYRNAARIRADHGLRVPDALHLAAARLGGCRTLWTNDRRFARAAGDFAVVVTA